MSGSTGPFDWSGLVLGPCQDTFGETVVWRGQSSNGDVQIRGIFDEGFRAIDTFGADDGVTPVHVTTSSPVLGIRLADFATDPVQGDLFQIRGLWYRLQDMRPDSHGAASLILNKADSENDPLPR
ncbi:hypothetical protein [Acetobacter estunensis]|uniref:head-tail joining protein n=1 Tax=Acetobacter estunensis TaxID=104097 RepID=UPI001C2DA798|nr:hypothetical protein [Acetobacter estunensis]MBV1835652.1 hypothetical protein [Acetobacter estunensis]MBV1836087.1 hypothetical protein [Acetobacter estunensis]